MPTRAALPSTLTVDIEIGAAERVPVGAVRFLSVAGSEGKSPASVFLFGDQLEMIDVHAAAVRTRRPTRTGSDVDGMAKMVELMSSRDRSPGQEPGAGMGDASRWFIRKPELAVTPVEHGPSPEVAGPKFRLGQGDWAIQVDLRPEASFGRCPVRLGQHHRRVAVLSPPLVMLAAETFSQVRKAAAIDQTDPAHAGVSAKES